MTEDMQEALSIRYICPRVALLSSGSFVIFWEGEEPEIISDFASVIDRFIQRGNIEALIAANNSRIRQPSATASTKVEIDLEELGL